MKVDDDKQRNISHKKRTVKIDRRRHGNTTPREKLQRFKALVVKANQNPKRIKLTTLCQTTKDECAMKKIYMHKQRK